MPQIDKALFIAKPMNKALSIGRLDETAALFSRTEPHTRQYTDLHFSVNGKAEHREKKS